MGRLQLHRTNVHWFWGMRSQTTTKNKTQNSPTWARPSWLSLFQPKLQKNFHHIVLPALAAVMDDVNNPRTRSHAAAALVNFVERCDEKILIPYLEPLLGKLFSLLQTGSLFVQQHVSNSQWTVREWTTYLIYSLSRIQAILAVAAVADVAGVHFTKYHDIFLPTLLQIVVHCKTKEQRKLRGQAVECISMIGVY